MLEVDRDASIAAARGVYSVLQACNVDQSPHTALGILTESACRYEFTLSLDIGPHIASWHKFLFTADKGPPYLKGFQVYIITDATICSYIGQLLFSHATPVMWYGPVKFFQSSLSWQRCCSLQIKTRTCTVLIFMDVLNHHRLHHQHSRLGPQELLHRHWPWYQKISKEPTPYRPTKTTDSSGVR